MKAYSNYRHVMLLLVVCEYKITRHFNFTDHFYLREKVKGWFRPFLKTRGLILLWHLDIPPLGTQRCDVESTSITLIQPRNNVVCPMSYAQCDLNMPYNIKHKSSNSRFNVTPYTTYAGTTLYADSSPLRPSDCTLDLDDEVVFHPSKHSISPILIWCWSTVYDVGPVSN